MVTVPDFGSDFVRWCRWRSPRDRPILTSTRQPPRRKVELCKTRSKRPPRNRRHRPERIAGRANVTDTPELKSYYAELAKLEAGALWTVANDIEPWFPEAEIRPRALAL